VVGDAVRVTVGAGCVKTACACCEVVIDGREIELVSLFSTALGFNGSVAAGFASALAAAAVLAGVDEFGEQAAMALVTAHARSQREKRGANLTINPAWRLTEVIEESRGAVLSADD
jgi:hypothetical protein